MSGVKNFVYICFIIKTLITMKKTFQITKEGQLLMNDIKEMKSKIKALKKEQETADKHRSNFLRGKIKATRGVIKMYHSHIKENYTLTV